MVDVVSNGRLDFGIGKGSEPIEYVRFGARREEATQRMIEGTEILRQAWSDEPVTFMASFSTTTMSGFCQSRCSGRIRRSGWGRLAPKKRFAGRGKTAFI